MELTNDFRVSVPPPTAWRVLTDVERIAPMLPGAQLQEIEGDDYRGVVKVKVGPITAQYKGTATFKERDEAAGKVVLKATGRDTRGQGNANATITARLVPDGEGTKVSVVTDLTVTGKVAQFGRGVLADVSSKLIGQFVDALEADLQRGDQPAAAGTPAGVNGGTPKAGESKAGESKAAEAKSGESKAVESKAGESKSGESKSGESKSGESKRGESKPADGTLIDGAAGAGQPTAAGDRPAAGTEQPSGSDKSQGADKSSGGEPAGADKPSVRKIDSPDAKPVDLLDAAGSSVAKRLVPVLGGVGALLAVLQVLRRVRRR